MAQRSNQPEHLTDAQLERLLKKGYGDTPPSAKFQQKLLKELDQEFARTYFPNEVQLAQGSQQQTQASNSSSTSVRPRRLIGLRTAMTMAVAASLLLVVALWNGQNAYGWAAMLRALDNCDWVQALAERSEVRGWISSPRGVLAICEDDEVAYYDRQQRIVSQYSATERVIYQEPVASELAERVTSEQLLRLLLGGDATTIDSDPHRYDVVSESWRVLEEGGSNVELLVTLRESGSRRKTYKLRVLVDAESHLPKSLELLTRERGVRNTLVFDYPSEGPETIFALGVPQETRVVTTVSVTDRKENTAARAAESGRMMSRQDESGDELDETQLAMRSELKQLEPIDGFLESAAVEIAEETRVDAKAAGGEALAKEFIETPSRPRVLAEDIVTAKDDAPSAEEVAVGTAPIADLPNERLALKTASPPKDLPRIDFAVNRLALEELVDKVNGQFSTYWEAQGITVAESAGDTEFLRRVYLDLTGRIPVPFEVYEFLEADPATRRDDLVDRLLESRDHATHLATVWRKLLLPDGVDTNTYGGTNKFDEWLADRFEKNVPYDQLVSQLLLAEGRVSDSGPILFYAALKLNPEELAAKTARTFLGMRMECAQCHDHPFDESISQEDFWGFAAHFAQISRPKGKIEMTSSVLRVRDNTRGEVMIPDTEEVVPPSLPYQVAMLPERAAEQFKKQSRRQQLVEWLTTKQNHRFARATVNRAWQHLFGLGLVEPADDMRADNLPTCPEVLDTLSHDFAANDYDLRRLLRALVLSDAYQLSSRAPSDEPSQSLAFARMNIKSFTADQLYDCINVATEPVSAQNNGDVNGALVRIGNSARQAFIEQFQAPPGQRTDYHAGIPQALTLMHGQLVHGATDLATSGLLKGINAPFFSGDDERIETLFLSTLSRFPDEAELERMLSHVEAAEDDEQRVRAFGDILWALLNSAEFTFIH